MTDKPKRGDYKPKHKPKNDTGYRSYIVGLVAVIIMGLATMWGLSWLLAPAVSVDEQISAQAAAASGQYLLAIERYTDALNVRSDNPTDLLIGRADAYYNVGDYAAALRDYDNALTYDATNADIYAGRARVHQAQGDLQAAADDLSQAIEWRDTPNPADYRLLGSVYDEMGQPAAALTAYQRYAELAPQPDATIEARIDALQN